MHDFIYNLGIIGLIIIFFYIVFWFDRRNKPSQFDLVRNQLQSITHPHLIVRGHGTYYIEFKDNYEHVYCYYHFNEYKKWLAHYKTCGDVNIISHGLTGYRNWEKWKV